MNKCFAIWLDNNTNGVFFRVNNISINCLFFKHGNRINDKHSFIKLIYI